MRAALLREMDGAPPTLPAAVRQSLANVTFAGRPMSAYQAFKAILDGARSGLMENQAVAELGLRADHAYRLFARNIDNAPACLLVGVPKDEHASKNMDVQWIDLLPSSTTNFNSNPNAASVIPASAGEQRIFLHLVKREGAITGVQLLDDVIANISPGDPALADLQMFKRTAEKIDQLYPPFSARSGAEPSEIERALRFYDVSNALALIGFDPNTGTLTDAVKACQAALTEKNLDAICALLVACSPSLVSSLQSTKNRRLGMSMREVVMMEAAKLNHPALRKYLKQFPYPYYTDKGDSSVSLNTLVKFEEGRHRGDPIVCRHLATAWLMSRFDSETRKVDYSNFDSADALSKLDSDSIESAMHAMLKNAEETHVLHIDDWGKKFLIHMFDKLDDQILKEGVRNTGKWIKHFVILTKTHMLAGAVSAKQKTLDAPISYSQFLYDPNPTATHRKIVTTNRDDINTWNLSSLYPHNNYADYHPDGDDLVGVHILRDENPFLETEEVGYPSKKNYNWVESPTSRLVIRHLAENGLHKEWNDIFHSNRASWSLSELGAYLIEASATFAWIESFNFTEMLCTYLRAINGLKEIDDKKKFRLLFMRILRKDASSHHSPAYLKTCLDEIMKLNLPEKFKITLIEAKESKHDVPFLHAATKIGRSDLVKTYLDCLRQMPISEETKYKLIGSIIKTEENEFVPAIVEAIRRKDSVMVEAFIDAITGLEMPAELKTRINFYDFAEQGWKRPVRNGEALTDDEKAIVELLDRGMSKLQDRHDSQGV
ncbi:MAG TPA: ShET2/EspL2 family type III secretion system effector toxin [Noviherbaspirillum sp.]